MKGYIYKHTAPNGKGYVGQTTKTPEKRWGKGGVHYSNYIGKAIKKYGWDNFNHEVLAEIEFDDIKELNNLEEYYILKENTLYPNGYNLKTEGENFIRTEEHKLNLAIGIANSINKRVKTFKERGCNIGKKNGMFGKMSPNKGKKMSPELIEKNRLGHIGKQNSQESKEKCSKAISNLIWITNGVINKRIKRNEPIPNGFYKGRKFTESGINTVKQNIRKRSKQNV